MQYSHTAIQVLDISTTAGIHLKKCLRCIPSKSALNVTSQNLWRAHWKQNWYSFTPGNAQDELKIIFYSHIKIFVTLVIQEVIISLLIRLVKVRSYIWFYLMMGLHKSTIHLNCSSLYSLRCTQLLFMYMTIGTSESISCEKVVFVKGQRDEIWRCIIFGPDRIII